MRMIKTCALALSLTCAAMAGGAIAAPETKAAVQSPVNLNQASAEELMALKGIGPKTAERIIAYRTENGPFQTPDQIVLVKGIGNAKFEKIKDQIVV